MKPLCLYWPFRGSGGCSSNARCLMAMVMVSGMCSSCFVDVHVTLVAPWLFLTSVIVFEWELWMLLIRVL